MPQFSHWHYTGRVFEQPVNLGTEFAASSASGSGQSARALIEWSPTLEVGFSEIDTQHRRLVEIANELNSAMNSGAGTAVVGRVLNELVDYTVKHFAYEEGMMRKHAYPQEEAHGEEHRKLVASVSAFKDKFDRGEAAISVELLGFIRDWLLSHILKVDKALARHLNARGLH